MAFDLRYPSPLLFVDRFKRIFDLDREDDNPLTKKVSDWSRKLSRFMMLNADFLRFRPSQIGTVSFLLAVKISFYSRNERRDAEGYRNLNDELDPHAKPLEMWTPAVEQLTGLSLTTDIKPLYYKLFRHIFKP